MSVDFYSIIEYNVICTTVFTVIEKGLTVLIGITKEIDRLGRLQIPKEIRERLVLEGKVQLIVTTDGLLIKNDEYKIVKIEKE